MDGRKHAVRVRKVKAHQKKNDVRMTAEEILHAEGNSHADTGAKMGLEMHRPNLDAVNLARMTKALQQMIAKFLVFT